MSRMRDMRSALFVLGTSAYLRFLPVRSSSIIADSPLQAICGHSGTINLVTWSDSAHRLLAVSLRDLPDELRPGHVDGAIDGPRLGARIVLEDFHHQCGVIGEDHAGLQHAQKSDLSFSLAESTGVVYGHVSR